MPGEDMKVPRSRNAVVVAHPDDEALWLSAVVASVERVVFGFGAAFDKPQRSEARRQAVAALPLSGIVNLEIPESTLRERLAKWKTPEPRYRSGVFAKYVALVGSAAEGAITNPR